MQLEVGRVILVQQIKLRDKAYGDLEGDKRRIQKSQELTAPNVNSS
jgi:hypothetical protein